MNFHLGTDILFAGEIPLEIKKLGMRFALFHDEKLTPFAEQWCRFLQEAGLDAHLFPIATSEEIKSREKKQELEDRLLFQKFGRDSCFIAIGGGVITDLVGFLAATYCRGVSLILIPTTLLAMVDAAIGGKTAVNTRFGKNLIGAFYPAHMVYADLKLLYTLPEREIKSGMAEVIKYALIGAPHLISLLQESSQLEAIISECIALKRSVVDFDPEEKKGYRRILNFGHTIAHAIELVEDYAITHGEAVAIGMLIESKLSVKVGTLSEKEFQRIDHLIRSFSFPLKLSSKVTKNKLLAALCLDKKSAQGRPRFVLLKEMGKTCEFDGAFCTEIDQDILLTTIDELLEDFS